MTWEIWRLDPDNEHQILEVLDFGDDYGECQAKYNDLAELARAEGGRFELRKDGQYAGMFSCSRPITSRT